MMDIPPSGIRKFFEMLIGHDDVISLSVGEPDFPTPWVMREEAFYHLEKGPEEKNQIHRVFYGSPKADDGKSTDHTKRNYNAGLNRKDNAGSNQNQSRKSNVKRL